MNRSAWIRTLWIALFAADCAAVLWFSLIPSDELPKTGVSDKVEHAIAFAGLAALGIQAFPGRHVRLALSLLALGIVIEFLQALMNVGRHADVLDALADAVGIAAILAVAMTLRVRVQSQAP